jgi:hypothetical protein
MLDEEGLVSGVDFEVMKKAMSSRTCPVGIEFEAL